MSETEYQDGLSLVSEHVPLWWPVEDPDATMYAILAAIGAQIDTLSQALQGIFDDRVLASASPEGLARLWDLIWGISSEEIAAEPPGTLVPYIQARSQEDGSVLSLTITLTALCLIAATNFQVGALVKFPGGGGGLTFPSDGSGIVLWQWDGITSFLPGSPLTFPFDGSGLHFPPTGEAAFETTVIRADDGTVGVSTSFATPLTFGSGAVVTIIEDFAHYQFTVEVNSALAFDRPAFHRAVERFRPSHTLPPIIREVP